jgi:hypothetical protein
MKKQLLASAMAVALATGMTTSAMAFGHGGGFHGGGFHGGGFGGFHTGSFGGFHAGSVGGFRGGALGTRSVGGFRNSFAAMPAARFSGVRGFNTAVRPGGWGVNHGWAGRRFVRGGWGWGGWGWDPGVDVGLGLLGFGLGVAALATPYCSPYDYGYWDYGYCGYPAYSTYVAW